MATALLACPACRSGRTRAGVRVRAFRFRRCRDCGSLFVDAQPARGETEALYEGETYFANPAFGTPEEGGYFGYKAYLDDRRHIEAKFDRVLETIERHVLRGRLLDVGAGPGFLVSRAVARGWEAAGVDVNPWAAAFARDELGVAVRTTALEDASLDSASYDAVTMMDLVEHVVDPESLVREARRILKPGGVLAVLTPDAASPVSRALGPRWPEVQRAPEHLVLYSVQGLTALLARHGLRSVERHSVGKTSSVETLLADVTPLAPRLLRPLGRALAGRALMQWTFELDPHTKFCLYAKREAA